ncbi:MAG: T9SS type A sorting domain-containing protein [Ignavibacteriae bacterium]|nr:T9SS type A sorting domain-containing protein [Ignavibacteriota bacterium]MCB9215974.1 T9SS type A sorting domain-containing protein [Ignavibacteria bacterium]
MNTFYSLLLLGLALCSASPLQAQFEIWEPTFGPHGGAVTALVTSTEGVVIAGTDRGLYRSVDSAKTWSRVSFDEYEIHVLCRDSSGQLYAGTDNGLFRSTDHGREWLSVGFSDTAILDITVQTNGMMFVAGDWGLFRKRGANDPWEKLQTEQYELRVVDAAADSVLYIADKRLVSQSRDNGDTWCPVYQRKLILSESEEDRGIVDIVSTKEGTSVAVIEGDYLGFVAQCGDTVATVLPKRIQERSQTFYRSHDGDIYVGTIFTGIRRCSNPPSSYWSFYSSGGTPVTAIVPMVDTLFYVGSNVLGVARIVVDRSQTLGTRWDHSADTMALTRGNVIRQFQGQLVLGTKEGLFVSKDRGDRWERVDRTYMDIHLIDATDSLVWYAGRDWEGAMSTIDPTAPGKYHRLDFADGVLSLKARGRYVFVGLQGKRPALSDLPFIPPGSLWRTIDNGTKWEKILKSINVNTIAAIDDATWLIGTNQGMLRSTDYGDTWSDVQDMRDTTIFDIHYSLDRTVYALQVGGFFKSSDFGLTWERIVSLNGVPSAITTNFLGRVFVEYRGQVYSSENKGRNWELFDSSLPINKWVLTVDEAHRLIAAGEYDNVWRTKQSTASVENDPGGTVTSTRLLPNYPEPATVSTQITYQLAHPEVIRLSIVDIMGREQRMLREGRVEEGIHKEEFDVAGLPSGLYFIRLVTETEMVVEPIRIENSKGS